MARLINTPNVGDGITVHHWSDAHAYTVVRVSPSGKTFWARRDKATRINRADDIVSPGGFAAHTESPKGQEWSYEPDPEGAEISCRQVRRPSGFAWKASNSDKVVTEGRHEFYDYNF